MFKLNLEGFPITKRSFQQPACKPRKICTYRLCCRPRSPAALRPVQPGAAASAHRRVQIESAIPNRAVRASGTWRQRRRFVDSYNEGRSMNAATRDKMIGGVALFATFAFFSTIIAGFFN
jgi:hypothetical protein